MCKDYNKSKIFPNNQFVYELWAANEGLSAIENMSRQIGKTG